MPRPEAAAATPPVRWLSDHEQCAWRTFLDMHAQLAARLNREMLEHSGLSSADFAVLVRLSEHPEGRMRVLELARALQWEKSRLSHQLTRMQQRGLVERSFCSEDRRGAVVVLTVPGRDAVEGAAPAHVESVRRYLFDALTAQQLDTLHTIAAATIERLGSTVADGGDAADAAPECDTSAHHCSDGLERNDGGDR